MDPTRRRRPVGTSRGMVPPSTLHSILDPITPIDAYLDKLAPRNMADAKDSDQSIDEPCQWGTALP